ncbi:MAG: NrfD/PsrC family molybdoenzyme membrane anchor subunit [Planctomycetota bacterium]
MQSNEKSIPLVTPGTIILWLLILLGAALAIFRFTQGLGASTNLSDKFPWGLWIGVDVLSGVALAAGGFTIAAAVYIFNLKKYHPIVRPAILTAFLGYTMVIVALLFDLGKPWNIWHPMIMWQHHSVMFEVGWCVMLYSTVLALEFSPAVLEKFKMHGLLKIIKAVTIPLVIAGIILSTLHQSSLGSLFLIVPDKLHAIWYTPLLPVMFFVSAVMVGLAMVTFEAFLSSKAFNRTLELDLLSGLAKAEIFVLFIYFALKMVDMGVRGSLPLAFQGTLEGNMFLLEIGLGVVLPFLLLCVPAVRTSRGGLFASSLMVIAGLIINRMNMSVIGMLQGSNASYFPSWMEFAVTAAVIAGGLIAFRIAVKYFNVFPSHNEPDKINNPHINRTSKMKEEPVLVN